MASANSIQKLSTEAAAAVYVKIREFDKMIDDALGQIGNANRVVAAAVKTIDETYERRSTLARELDALAPEGFAQPVAAPSGVEQAMVDTGYPIQPARPGVGGFAKSSRKPWYRENPLPRGYSTSAAPYPPNAKGNYEDDPR